MPLYDVSKSVADAKKDLEHFDKNNYKDLLLVYSTRMGKILKEYNGQESNIPLNHEYFMIRNKVQYVTDRFTKE